MRNRSITKVTAADNVQWAPVRSQAEVAALLGISQAAVHTTEKRALKKLKRSLRRRLGESFNA